ncbi:hypothetical protein EDD11_008273 [Mortierella claussenii]|nr:hypothetical protein EDD11_008273 [Mortierella claussenii]
MEDVHMETPPAASAAIADPLVEVAVANTHSELEQQQISKRDAIRSRLGVSVVSDFGIYRDILEEHHDRRERIIKVCRDINNFSKKMIFALHRVEPKGFLPQFATTSEAMDEFKKKHAIVLKLFHRVAVDLQGSNYYRYQRSVSGAMQEYIEAMTLEYYLVHGELMPKSALEADFIFMTSPEQLHNPDLIIGIGQTGPSGGGGGGGPHGKFNKENRRALHSKDNKSIERKPAIPGVARVDSIADISRPEDVTAGSKSNAIVVDQASALAITPTETFTASEGNLIRLTLEVTDEDYLLGIADLTGELMRLAINTLGQSLMAPAAQEVDATLGTPLLLPTPEERVQQILSFLRSIKSGFDALSLTRMSPIFKKMGALKQSLNKIEMACYNVKVRGAEYPPEILRQMLISGSAQDGGNAAGGDTGNDEEDS